jgi:hypothetical protein
LAGIHTTAEFIARGPEGGVEVGFLDCHANVLRDASMGEPCL